MRGSYGLTRYLLNSNDSMVTEIRDLSPKIYYLQVPQKASSQGCYIVVGGDEDVDWGVFSSTVSSSKISDIHIILVAEDVSLFHNISIKLANCLSSIKNKPVPLDELEGIMTIRATILKDDSCFSYKEAITGREASELVFIFSIKQEWSWEDNP